jgi:hypothetical protein
MARTKTYTGCEYSIDPENGREKYVICPDSAHRVTVASGNKTGPVAGSCVCGTTVETTITVP